MSTSGVKDTTLPSLTDPTQYFYHSTPSPPSTNVLVNHPSLLTDIRVVRGLRDLTFDLFPTGVIMNSTNCTTSSEDNPCDLSLDDDSHGPVTIVVIVTICGLIVAGTILGNILVCTAVAIVRKLRTPSNLLIVSLAVSDLLVAILDMPFATMYEVGIGCLSLIMFTNQTLFSLIFIDICNFKPEFVLLVIQGHVNNNTNNIFA